ncbi:hypothetical protein LCL96_14550 [Rossellomorea aquimaris]|uniref:hypothetical protein n=1 Tax=Rossellomorea aquimaris TaxID=189382 RepID=UPI001CD6653A|nr:hypothetical protein [Rossellomorea aquimaris]MCA1060155.1 hypothetical protein [Rossellomorea aquimaris]
MELFIIFVSVIVLIVFLFIFYIIVERAVRDGINNSVIGRYLEEKHGIKDPQGDENLNDDTFKGE